MTHRPLRLMFLGNRRIAWEVLKLMSSNEFRSSFDIKALVTDSKIWNGYRGIAPYGDPIFIPNDKRQTDRIAETIKAQSVEVLISIQYNWIIPGSILEMVGRRAFNLHNARLPDYKGYHSITHAIANRDTNYETTIHWMADEVDSGDIAYVASTPIQADDTAKSLYLRTIDAAMIAVRKLLRDLASDTKVPRSPQPFGRGAFYSRNSVASMADVSGKLDADVISHVARATYFPPNNTAYFYCAGKKYLILPESEVQALTLLNKSINEPEF